MFLCYLLSLCILLLKISLFQSQIQKENLENKYINPYAYYRIDSAYNGYSITIQDGQVQIKMHKKGDSQNFIIKQYDSNLYYIESRLDSKRIGVNDNNELIVYNKNDNANNEKMLWNIALYKTKDDDNIYNQYSIQNKYNLNYLEISVINETHNYLNCSLKNFEESVYFKAVFNFVKIFEIIDIKPDHLAFIENEPIDIVIKYIDLTDKNLNREGIIQIKKDEDNEELKYSVRSILKYVPWVRKIFIIMPNEKVRFFKPIEEINDKFVYVKDKDLIGFDSANSAVFQFNLFRLNQYGLSENFIYMDDDYFFGKELKKSDFFYYDEETKKVVPFIITFDYKEMDYNETINYYNKLFDMRKQLDSHAFWGWKLSILASEKLLLENFHNHPMITTYFTHVAIPVNIHDVEECYDLILRRYKYIEETLYSIQRHILILQSEHLFVLYGLNVKKRKVHSIWFNHLLLNSVKEEYLHAPLYVINTDGNVKYTEDDYKKAKSVLEQRYPERTKYELPFDIVEKEETKKENETNIEDKEKEKKEQEKKSKKKIKTKENIDFNLTYNEFYMESIYIQKKKEMEKKYKTKIKEYKKANYYLLILFIFLLILMIIIIYYSKNKN